MIIVEIDSVDRTNNIRFGTLSKVDNINQKTDTLTFTIEYGGGKTFRPATNSEIVMYDGATKVFGGKIYQVQADVISSSQIDYRVSCKDYSYDLGRLLVVEEYINMTIKDIIADILSNYAPTFTDTNVVSNLNVLKVVFDHVTVLAAIEKLAQLSGYSWYIDYDKDVHFFAKNTEIAPFNLTDLDGNYIPDTLETSDDFSQIRNRIFVKGGEIEGISRTETLGGTGSQLQFKLSNKFASAPTVEVGGVPQTVGIDFLDDEASFDCFWDYNQQYIRFKVAPALFPDNIEVTGIPLYTLIIMVEEPISIAQYGVFEYSITDKTIKSREAGVALAKAQLTTYKDGLIEGGFETYESGLRSGMVININSTLLGIDEDFLVQSVNYKMLTPERGIFKVKLATLRSVGLIDFLIGLLQVGDRMIEDTSNTVLEKTVFPIEGIQINDVIDVNTNDYPQTESITITETVTPQALNYDVEFVAGPLSAPSGTKRLFILNGSPLA